MFSGIIMFYVKDWMSIIVNAMLGGELLRCQWPCLSGIDLTKISFKSS